MILYPMEKMLEHASSRYQLVNLVAHRAREISKEAETEGEPLEEKPVTMALNEVLDGTLQAEPEQEETGDQA